MKSDRLKDKVALISGGARGMGANHARVFVEQGAKVVIGDVLDEDGKLTADALGEAARFVHLDVTDEESWTRAVRTTTEAFGRLDVLVNNAGIFRIAPIATTTAEEFMEVTGVNQLGVLLGMKAAIPAMLESGGGSIVNISSVAGLTGALAQVSYGASKWAVRGMTKIAAVELASVGIRVNSVHPGLIDTPMTQAIPIDWNDVASQVVPMRRVATAADVTPVVLFLASDESAYSTGAEFVVDGGMTAGWGPRG
jgi:3alpha(or 20beta)-hydroxysteroid dehydrogenase